MSDLEHDGGDEVLTVQEALARIQTSPPLRKVKSYVDSTDLSADMKALLYDVAQITVKVGEAIIAVGRRVLEIAMGLVSKFPNTTLGLIVAVVLTTVVSSGLSWAPLIAVALNKLILLLGITAGAIEDIRQKAMKDAMDRVAAQFVPLQPIS